MSAAIRTPQAATRAIAAIVAGVVVIVLVVLLGGSGDGYKLGLQMSNASGLREGSQVLLGGVEVGTVDKLDFDRSANAVAVRLDLDKDKVRVGRGARAGVVAANLLGEKYIALEPGDASAPLPDGGSLPASAVTTPTDLDQIVDVLDRPTSERLGILLQQAGLAVAGRKSDVNEILRQFPLSLDHASRLLDEMVDDNRTLAGLVASSNRFIARINTEGPELKRLVGSSGAAADALNARSGDLRRLVEALPLGLRSIGDIFERGGVVTRAAIPSVERITEALPHARRVLDAVEPFRKAAVPTLDRAADAAPQLSKLASRATPTVRQAVPMLAALGVLGEKAGPLSSWLGLSSQDLFNIFGMWTGAIQFRDGLSHIFNGDLYMLPGTVVHASNQGANARQRRENMLDIKNPSLRDLFRKALRGLDGPAPRADRPSRPAPRSPLRVPATSGPARRPARPAPQAQPLRIPDALESTESTVTKLLDFLLAP